jgi:hypothetical protein
LNASSNIIVGKGLLARSTMPPLPKADVETEILPGTPAGWQVLT